MKLHFHSIENKTVLERTGDGDHIHSIRKRLPRAMGIRTKLHGGTAPVNLRAVEAGGGPQAAPRRAPLPCACRPRRVAKRVKVSLYPLPISTPPLHVALLAMIPTSETVACFMRLVGTD
jgi:hypothetical protein